MFQEPKKFSQYTDGLRAGQPGFNFWQVQWWILSLRHRVQTGSGFHPDSFPVGTVDSYSRGKVVCLAREVNHSAPPISEVKNAWSYTSTPPYLHGAVPS